MSQPRWIEALNSVRGTRIAFAVVAIVSAVLFFGNLGRIGIWEPWEANEIFVANEYLDRGPPEPNLAPAAPSWNWAVPTFEKKPVARPLLKTWLIAIGGDTSGELRVGKLELQARLPIALCVWAFVLVGFVWVRRRFDTESAALTGLIFASFPVIFMGVHNVATEMLFVVTTSLALVSWFELQYAEGNKRWTWAVALGASLAFTILDHRLIGLDLVLIVMAAQAVTELVYESVRSKEPLVTKVELGGFAASLVAIGAMFLIGRWVSQSVDSNLTFRTSTLQWFAALLPLFITCAGFALARRTRAGRTFLSLPNALALGIAAITLGVLAYAYGDANPTLLKNGVVFGKIPVLEYLLENHIFGQSLAAKHMTFDLWVRQIGFAIVTWVGLAPLAVAYLGRATRIVDDVEDLTSPQLVVRRYLLIWMTFAAVVMMGAAAYGSYFYPAYFPIAVGIALMLTDRPYWAEVRQKPLALYAMGFVAVTIVMMVGKDLERFPARFIEVYTVMQEKLDLKDDFSFGSLMKTLKYVLMSVLIVHFFGVVSWLGLTWRRRGDIWRAVRHPRTHLRIWLDSTPIKSSYEDRADDKAAYRQESGLWSRVARFVETPDGFPIVILTTCLVTAFVYAGKFIPEITNHMSQRGVFETFIKSAPQGATLWRYDVASRDTSVYLKDVKNIPSSIEFRKKFEGKERVYAVIPRDNLARINYEFRQATHKNLVVLDQRSNRLLLVSNQLAEGEQDHNYVAKNIIEDPSIIPNKLEFDDGKGNKVHPVFDGRLEMIGYGFDRQAGDEGVPSYKWGETAIVDYYFKVLKRVPGNEKIFVHLDTPGNRISGDHYPNDGDFPTNYWLEGDIVRARHHLKIEEYSTPGVYTLNFGFYIGSKRMAVEPRKAHDGSNRVPVAKLRVRSL